MKKNLVGPGQPVLVNKKRDGFYGLGGFFRKQSYFGCDSL
jgi:hypothetical protein